MFLLWFSVMERGNIGIKKSHDNPFAFPTSMGWGKTTREKLITILILYHRANTRENSEAGRENVRYRFYPRITLDTLLENISKLYILYVQKITSNMKRDPLCI